MKVSRQQASENRERVLQTAATLFRESGFAGVGLADLMKAAGLTHGAFYGQFDSKEELMARACSLGAADTIERWESQAADAAGQDNPQAALGRLVTSYLSPAHRDTPGRGCVVAALGSDVAREGAAVRAAVSEGLLSTVDTLARFMPGEKEDQRRQAIAAYASMVGGLILSRVIDDSELSKEILAVVTASILEQPGER